MTQLCCLNNKNICSYLCCSCPAKIRAVNIYCRKNEENITIILRFLCHLESFCLCFTSSDSTQLLFLFCLHQQSQDEESVPVELRNLQEYKELLQLKRLKKQKLQEIREDNAGVQHMSYKVTYFCTHNNFLLHAAQRAGTAWHSSTFCHILNTNLREFY